MSIYMPMVVELPIAMLACARIGAVHSVVFGGFSAEALAGEPAAQPRPTTTSRLQPWQAALSTLLTPRQLHVAPPCTQAGWRTAGRACC